MWFSRASLLLAAVCVTACGSETSDDAGPLRSVHTIIAAPVEPVRERRFPTVLEPAEITHLAFDVGGRLGSIDLGIGQRVAAGEVLATVEATDADLRLQQARAALSEAEIVASNAARDADRQTRLFRQNATAEAERDRAVAASRQANARVDQAERNLELLQETLDDTSLQAPFDAVVNSIEVRAFDSVAAGQPVVTLYPDERLQARIVASYGVAAELSLGQAVSVVTSDGSREPLAATISEIARRAPAVSSFPVVVSLADTRADLRSGMAAEVRVELPLDDARRGIPIPIGALALQREADLTGMPRRVDVFVYREDADGSAWVEPRSVLLAAAVDESVLVVDGLEPGERVVSAGVPYLHPGQRVASVTSPERVEPRLERRSGSDHGAR